MKNKTSLIIAVLLTGVFYIQTGTVTAATDKTSILSESEAVYAQLRAAVTAGDKEKIKSFLDASTINDFEERSEKSFDKIPIESFQLIFPDLTKFTYVSSDIKGNKLYWIKKFDEQNDRMLTDIVGIEFIKQTDGKTWEIGHSAYDEVHYDSQDKKANERDTNRSIRRIRREFGLKIKKLSLKQLLEEASSATTDLAWSEDKSTPIKFIEAVKIGNHAAYIRLDGTGSLFLFSFKLNNDGEWDSSNEDANYVTSEKLSKSKLKKKTDEMKNDFFADSTVSDFTSAVWDGDYQAAAKLFSAGSNQTADGIKGFFDQFPTLKSYFSQKKDIKEKSAVFLVEINDKKFIMSLIKENGIWKIGKIVPDTSKTD